MSNNPNVTLHECYRSHSHINNLAHYFHIVKQLLSFSQLSPSFRSLINYVLLLTVFIFCLLLSYIFISMFFFSVYLCSGCEVYFSNDLLLTRTNIYLLLSILYAFILLFTLFVWFMFFISIFLAGQAFFIF